MSNESPPPHSSLVTHDSSLSVRGLRKVYGDLVALDHLDLDVPRGSIFGFLGPNGAGKSTTIKIALGLVHATSGAVEIFGQPAERPEARARVGFLPEHFRFHDWLTAREFLDFHGTLYGLPPARRRSQREQVLARVGLTHRGDSPLRTFSKGMLQRIGLAQALLNDPELVILDEPTSGLDPVARRELRDLLAELRAGGATVLLNSHILSEVELVCDRVAILNRGRLIGQGTVDELLTRRFEVIARVSEVSRLLVEQLARLPRPVEQIDGRTLRYRATSDAEAAELAEAIVTSGVQLYRLEPERTTLEDLFLSLVKTSEVE